MTFPRLSGVLLHPISLPSIGGIGDLGPAAYEFLDFLAEAKQGLWQVLPLNPPANGNSPYSSTSAFSGHPQLVSLEQLVADGWLESSALSSFRPETSHIDYAEVNRTKLPLLWRAGESFLKRADGESRQRFQQFCTGNDWWLEDYVAFDLLRERHGRDWSKWPPQFARRDAAALHNFRASEENELSLRRVVQFFFWEQWHSLRKYCARKSIKVVGDIAIFVDYDSADVWAHRDLFRLREDNLQPEVVSGVPPDYFSATGQRWGNPLYDWDKIRATGYQWWVQRLRWATQTCDFIRLDHFRGFAQFWEIPATEPNAIHGRWVNGPGDELFQKIRGELGGLPFFAEDLGFITSDVVALRDRHEIPGMAVLQLAFGDVGAHAYLPHRVPQNRVIYTGTHDNDTSLGWWGALGEQERSAVQALGGPCDDGHNWGLIRLAQSSQAAFSIVPLQDVLGLGSEARLNTPSTHTGNYHWRYQAGALKPELASKLAALAEVTDRTPDSQILADADLHK